MGDISIIARRLSDGSVQLNIGLETILLLISICAIFRNVKDMNYYLKVSSFDISNNA